MTIADVLLQDFDIEIANTRRTLERIPEDRTSYKCHDKSMPLGKLAMHCASLPIFGVYIMEDAGMDMAAPTRQRIPLIFESRAATVACLKKPQPNAASRSPPAPTTTFRNSGASALVSRSCSTTRASSLSATCASTTWSITPRNWASTSASMTSPCRPSTALQRMNSELQSARNYANPGNAPRIQAAMSPEHNAHNRANQGLNTKVFMAAIIAALLVIIAGIFFFLAGRGTKDIPKANQPNPNSALRRPHTEAAS